jgi:hypothetical protein
MAGYTEIANLETGLSVRGKLNTQFEDLFTENTKACITVANAAALAAIPEEYISAGKLAYVLDEKVMYIYVDPTGWTESVDQAITLASADISGTLDVAGMTTLDDATIGGAVTIAETLDVTGVTTATDLDASGDATVGGTFKVTGVTTLADATIDTATCETVTASVAVEGVIGKFGDISGGDYSEFEADGTLKFNGAATVWNDIIMPAANLRPGSSAPTFSVIRDGLFGYRFDAGTARELHGAAEIPHDYKEGSDLVVHVHWEPTTTNTGDIVWGFEYSIADPHATFPASTTATMTPAAASGTIGEHELNNIVTIDGTGITIGAIIIFRVYRQNGGTDTFTGNAFLHSVGVHYESDTAGSRAITTKDNP